MGGSTSSLLRNEKGSHQISVTVLLTIPMKKLRRVSCPQFGMRLFAFFLKPFRQRKTTKQNDDQYRSDKQRRGVGHRFFEYGPNHGQQADLQEPGHRGLAANGFKENFHK